MSVPFRFYHTRQSAAATLAHVDHEFNGNPFTVKIAYISTDGEQLIASTRPMNPHSHILVLARLQGTPADLSNIEGSSAWMSEFSMKEETQLKEFIDILRELRPGLEVTDLRDPLLESDQG